MVSVPFLCPSLETPFFSLGYSSSSQVTCHGDSLLSSCFQSSPWGLVLIFPYSLWNLSSHCLAPEGPQLFQPCPYLTHTGTTASFSQLSPLDLISVPPVWRFPSSLSLCIIQRMPKGHTSLLSDMSVSALSTLCSNYLPSCLLSHSCLHLPPFCVSGVWELWRVILSHSEKMELRSYVKRRKMLRPQTATSGTNAQN